MAAGVGLERGGGGGGNEQEHGTEFGISSIADSGVLSFTVSLGVYIQMD